jgi:hypothetical protein
VGCSLAEISEGKAAMDKLDELLQHPSTDILRKLISANLTVVEALILLLLGKGTVSEADVKAMLAGLKRASKDVLSEYRKQPYATVSIAVFFGLGFFVATFGAVLRRRIALTLRASKRGSTTRCPKSEQCLD